MTVDDSSSGYVLPKRPLDLGHASTRAEKRQLKLVVFVAEKLTSLVDRGVQPASEIGRLDVFTPRLPGSRVDNGISRSEPKFENDRIRNGTSLTCLTRRPPAS